MDQTFIQQMISSGGVAAVALFALWQLGKSQEREKSTTEKLIELVEKNTAALTALSSVVDRVGNVVNGCAYANRAAINHKAVDE